MARDYWTEHRIWHLIGAEEYERLIRELTNPESLVNAALSRGVRSIEHDLALVLAHCSPSQLRDEDLLLRALQSRIRQSVDVLERCNSRESFCPTLAARLQGEPELADLVAGLSRYAEDPVIVVKGPPHDMDDRRLIQRLPKRVAGVKALSWLTEPGCIGIAYQDGSARIWEPRSDQLYSSRLPDSVRAAVACWSQSGGEVVIGRSDGTVTIWPSPRGANPEALQEQGITCVAWSKKGELAYAGWHGDLVCWSPSGVTHRRATKTGGVPVTALAWSHAGTQLAFASAQGAVFIFSEDGPVQVLPMDHGGAASLAWSCEGPLACAGWDGTVRVVEPDGRPCDIQPEPSDRRGPPAIAWDHDGERLAIGGYDGAVAVWCAGGCRKVLQPKDRAVRALAWSPTAPFLAAAHDDGAIRIWRDTDGDEDGLPPIRVQGTAIVGVAWSSREDNLVAAGSDGAVTIWAPFEANVALRSVIRTDGPTAVRCSPDGRTVATADETGSVLLWDVDTREERDLPWRLARKDAVGWAPSGVSRIAIGGADGVVHEWTADPGWVSRIVHEHSAWVSDLAWSSNGQLATLGRDWMLHISQPSRPTYDLVAHEGGTTAIAWSPQGSLLATAGNDWLVRIWCPPDSISAIPPQNQQWRLIAEFRAHLGGVTALEWAPGGTELATAGWDRRVRRWQLRLPAAPTPLHQSVGWRLTDTWRTRASAVSVLAWSPNGTSLVGGDRRGHLQTWRCEDPNSTEMRSSHQGPLTALRWSKNANRILSTGTDGTLRLWSLHGEECARIAFHAPLHSLDLHDDSGLVAVGGEYGATILQLHTRTANDGVNGYEQPRKPSAADILA
jgi:WD40 repeat protein